MSRGVLAWSGALALSAAILGSSPSHAGNPNTVKPADYANTPAARYASMEGSACLQELQNRGVSYTQVSGVAGVDTPVRLLGLLHGVKLTQVNRTTDEALNSDGGVTDCRLLLALDDFASKLSTQGIKELGFVSAYRADSTGTTKVGERHPAGLAIDVAWFKKQDGRELNVQRDFQGRVGARTCGHRAEAPRSRTEQSASLRQVVCGVASDRLFNLVLTPNYNREHHDHIHFEVRRNIDWILVQ